MNRLFLQLSVQRQGQKKNDLQELGISKIQAYFFLSAGFHGLFRRLRKRFNQKIPLVLTLICLPLILGATKNNFQITGVKGKLLANIQARLTELTQTKPLSARSEEELRLHVEQAMQPYGYFKPQITLRAPQQINIIPGSQMLISHFKVTIQGEGATNTKMRKALNDLPVKQGKPLNSANYEKAKQKFLNMAERQGYLHAAFEKAELLIDKTNYNAQISWLFNTGPQYYFGQVQFDPTYISPQLLKRYIPFNDGQPYSPDQILNLNSQLLSSGYFRRVSVQPQIEGTERHIPIDVHLYPASRLSYSLGAGYGTDTGIRGRAGLHIVPVNRAGDKFNLVTLGSFQQSALQAQYVMPGQNPVTDQYNINTNLSAMDYNVGYSNAVLFSLAQQHNVPHFQRSLSINSLYENYHYVNQPRKEKVALFPKGTFTWLDKKDKLFSPSGYNITLTGLGATKAILANENFVQASINAKAALTIPSLRTRFYFHTIQGMTQMRDINQLPLSLALLLGGAENLKGYTFNSIGPGKILSYGGLEIQKELKEKWYFVGFFDSGDVYMPRSKQLKNDAGIGLMWVSPVGPIKIGIAQSLDSSFDRHGRGPRLVVNMGPDL